MKYVLSRVKVNMKQFIDIVFVLFFLLFVLFFVVMDVVMERVELEVVGVKFVVVIFWLEVYLKKIIKDKI